MKRVALFVVAFLFGTSACAAWWSPPLPSPTPDPVIKNGANVKPPAPPSPTPIIHNGAG